MNDTHVSEHLGGHQGSKILPTVRDEQVQDLLIRLDMSKSMGQDDVLPRVMRELVDTLTQPFSTVFEKSWLSEEGRRSPWGLEKGNITPSF